MSDDNNADETENTPSGRKDKKMEIKDFEALEKVTAGGLVMWDPFTTDEDEKKQEENDTGL